MQKQPVRGTGALRSSPQAKPDSRRFEQEAQKKAGSPAGRTGSPGAAAAKQAGPEPRKPDAAHKAPARHDAAGAAASQARKPAAAPNPNDWLKTSPIGFVKPSVSGPARPDPKSLPTIPQGRPLALPAEPPPPAPARPALRDPKALPTVSQARPLAQPANPNDWLKTAPIGFVKPPADGPARPDPKKLPTIPQGRPLALPAEPPAPAPTRPALPDPKTLPATAQGQPVSVSRLPPGPVAGQLPTGERAQAGAAEPHRTAERPATERPVVPSAPAMPGGKPPAGTMPTGNPASGNPAMPAGKPPAPNLAEKAGNMLAKSVVEGTRNTWDMVGGLANAAYKAGSGTVWLAGQAVVGTSLGVVDGGLKLAGIRNAKGQKGLDFGNGAKNGWDFYDRAHNATIGTHGVERSLRRFGAEHLGFRNGETYEKKGMTAANPESSGHRSGNIAGTVVSFFVGPQMFAGAPGKLGTMGQAAENVGKTKRSIEVMNRSMKMTQSTRLLEQGAQSLQKAGQLSQNAKLSADASLLLGKHALHLSSSGTTGQFMTALVPSANLAKTAKALETAANTTRTLGQLQQTAGEELGKWARLGDDAANVGTQVRRSAKFQGRIKEAERFGRTEIATQLRQEQAARFANARDVATQTAQRSADDLDRLIQSATSSTPPAKLQEWTQLRDVYRQSLSQGGDPARTYKLLEKAKKIEARLTCEHLKATHLSYEATARSLKPKLDRATALRENLDQLFASQSGRAVADNLKREANDARQLFQQANRQIGILKRQGTAAERITNFANSLDDSYDAARLSWKTNRVNKATDGALARTIDASRTGEALGWGAKKAIAKAGHRLADLELDKAQVALRQAKQAFAASGTIDDLEKVKRLETAIPIAREAADDAKSAFLEARKLAPQQWLDARRSDVLSGLGQAGAAGLKKGHAAARTVGYKALDMARAGGDWLADLRRANSAVDAAYGFGSANAYRLSKVATETGQLVENLGGLSGEVVNTGKTLFNGFGMTAIGEKVGGGLGTASALGAAGLTVARPVFDVASTGIGSALGLAKAVTKTATNSTGSYLGLETLRGNTTLHVNDPAHNKHVLTRMNLPRTQADGLGAFWSVGIGTTKDALVPADITLGGVLGSTKGFAWDKLAKGDVAGFVDYSAMVPSTVVRPRGPGTEVFSQLSARANGAFGFASWNIGPKYLGFDGSYGVSLLSLGGTPGRTTVGNFVNSDLSASLRTYMGPSIVRMATESSMRLPPLDGKNVPEQIARTVGAGRIVFDSERPVLEGADYGQWIGAQNSAVLGELHLNARDRILTGAGFPGAIPIGAGFVAPSNVPGVSTAPLVFTPTPWDRGRSYYPVVISGNPYKKDANQDLARDFPAVANFLHQHGLISLKSNAKAPKPGSKPKP